MAHIKPFIGGMLFGNVLILNHIYENEMLK